MGVGSGLYMYDVVVKRSRSLSHLLMSSFVDLDAERCRIRLRHLILALICVFMIRRTSVVVYRDNENSESENERTRKDQSLLRSPRQLEVSSNLGLQVQRWTT